MPEGVRAYPRWEGIMRTGPLFGTIALQELKRAFRNIWVIYALALIAAFVVGHLTQLNQNVRLLHTTDNYITFLNNMRWGALAVTAIVAGPALLEDQRRGALELYMARAVGTGDYLVGKILATFTLATLSMVLPAVVYYAGTYMIAEDHPPHWDTAIYGGILYSVMWALLVTGVGLGLSAVARSSVGATLLLLGGFLVADKLVAELLSEITLNKYLFILSPFAVVAQQTTWIFDVRPRFVFPYWWGLAVWGGLLIAGWGLVAWKHPRVRGAEDAGV